MEKISDKFADLIEVTNACLGTFNRAQFFEGYAGSNNVKKNCSEDNRQRILNLKNSLEAAARIAKDYKALHEFKEENARISGILDTIENKLLTDVVKPFSSLIEKSDWAEILSKLNSEQSNAIARVLRKINSELPIPDLPPCQNEIKEEYSKSYGFGAEESEPPF